MHTVAASALKKVHARLSALHASKKQYNFAKANKGTPRLSLDTHAKYKKDIAKKRARLAIAEAALQQALTLGANQ